MNIYFSCSITGGRQDQHIYARIVEYLIDHDHVVPTADLANPDILIEENKISAEEVYSRDIEWVDDCDVVIAEVSTPSHGVGYEIAYALSNEKGKRISKMLLGNHQTGFTIHVYSDYSECLNIINGFLSEYTGK
jgi:nucleoside 2-deoxyribosyltransferase